MKYTSRRHTGPSLIKATAKVTVCALPHHISVLNNGLTLIIHKEHKAPAVKYKLNVKDKTADHSGFAHSFECLVNDNDIKTVLGAMDTDSSDQKSNTSAVVPVLQPVACNHLTALKRGTELTTFGATLTTVPNLAPFSQQPGKWHNPVPPLRYSTIAKIPEIHPKANICNKPGASQTLMLTGKIAPRDNVNNHIAIKVMSDIISSRLPQADELTATQNSSSSRLPEAVEGRASVLQHLFHNNNRYSRPYDYATQHTQRDPRYARQYHPNV